MFPVSAKQVLGLVVFIVLLGTVLFFGVFKNIEKEIPTPTTHVIEEKVEIKPTRTTIGKSVEGRNIEVYTYGTGATHLTFVGGVHGGYEWNSVLLAYTFIDYLDAHPDMVPKNLTIEIIPSANPDGLYKVTQKNGRFTSSDVSTDSKVLESARFNANSVDLNRNFDCKWKPESTWRSKVVSAGTAPFSEPEAKAIQSLILKSKPSAVIFWHSQSNAVYASQCASGILPETLTLMNMYSKASGYPAVKTFDAYQTTGAADDWLASINIPAVTVELKTHETIEWEENLAGIKALISHYGK